MGELASRWWVFGVSGGWKEQLGRDHRTGPQVNNDVTGVTDQMVREAYTALVLGCKMEIPTK